MTEVVQIKKDATDEEILEEIRKFYQGTIDSHDSNASELLYESIQKIIQVACTKGSNKPQLLYELGFIFCKKYIAVNLTKLSKVFGLKNNSISLLLKQWAIMSHWDKNEKKALIHSFDPTVDLKLWTLRQPSPDDPVYKFFDKNSTDFEAKKVNVVNNINSTQIQNKKWKLTQDPLTSARFDTTTQNIISVPPKQWEFDLNPKFTLSYT